MAAREKLTEEFASLKHDASKVMADIGNISAQIREAGGDISSQFSEDISERISDNLESAKRKAAEIKGELGEQAQRADKHVRANPYLYTAIAAGVGFIVGKLLARQKKH